MFKKAGALCLLVTAGLISVYALKRISGPSSALKPVQMPAGPQKAPMPQSVSEPAVTNAAVQPKHPPQSKDAALPIDPQSEPVSTPSPLHNPETPASGVGTWKVYSSPQYKFEIRHPADWILNDKLSNIGETRALFKIEKDGPTQDQEGSGDFSDGAILTLSVTGTNGLIEDQQITRSQPPRLITSTPEQWLKSQSSPFSGNHLEYVSIAENGFNGIVQVAHDDANPGKVWGEAGGAYRTLPGGRVVLISWERMNGANEFSYRAYLLPIISSFTLTQ